MVTINSKFEYGVKEEKRQNFAASENFNVQNLAFALSQK